MTAEQRAEAFEAFKAKVNETDAARRDGGWALAMERGAVIAEMVSALKAITTWIDEENSNREGTFRELFPSCNECTQNSTPIDRDKGPCPYHRAQAAIKRGATA
jgi:hypothetical protein